MTPEIVHEYPTMMDTFQIWACISCGQLRHWGFGRPAIFPESISDPLLNCSKCKKPMRHSFDRIVFNRQGRHEIEFGEWWMTKEKR